MDLAIFNSRLIHIDNAKEGVLYLCPECKAELTIKRGDFRRHHFAHKSLTGCQGNHESFLHKLAKRIIKESKGLVLPDFTNGKRNIKSQYVRFDLILDEVGKGSTVVDLLAKVGNKELAIEIKFSHGVDEIKKHKFKSMKLAVLEIDLNGYNGLYTTGGLREYLIDGQLGKKWVNNPRYPAASEIVRIPRYSDYPDQHQEEKTLSSLNPDFVKRLRYKPSFIPEFMELKASEEGKVFCLKEYHNSNLASKAKSAATINTSTSSAPGNSILSPLGIVPERLIGTNSSDSNQGSMVFQEECDECPFFGGRFKSLVKCSAHLKLE